MKNIIILSIFAATAATFGGDMIAFKNGDILTGTLIEQTDEVVFFDSDTLGRLQLRPADIQEVQVEVTESRPEPPPVSPLATPLLPDGEEVSEPKEGVWSGQAGIAIAMRETADATTDGRYQEEQFQTYRIYGHIDWTGRKNSLNWKWTYRYSEDEIRTRDDFLNITQKYNRSLQHGYYAEAKTIYQRDYNRNIDNEYLQTAEIGRTWFNHPRLVFSTSAGGGYHQYDSTLPGESETISKPKWVFDESLEWRLIHSLTLFQKYTHLGDLENYHFVFSSGLENTLMENLFLRFEYRFDRDTEAGYNGNSYYDRALLTSLLYKF